MAQCRHPGQSSWRTALALSVLFGGFGIDRFYLGHIGWGFLCVLLSMRVCASLAHRRRPPRSKLLSLGGVGIWTLIDATMIAIGYLGPADGSLYI